MFQDEFFDDSVSHLMPITLRHLAEDIHMLELTVSHAIAKERVYPHQSLFELTHFFQSAGRLSCVKA